MQSNGIPLFKIFYFLLVFGYSSHQSKAQIRLSLGPEIGVASNLLSNTKNKYSLNPYAGLKVSTEDFYYLKQRTFLLKFGVSIFFNG